MDVSYKGFTGELVRLERQQEQSKNIFSSSTAPARYSLSMYDKDKKVTHVFTDVDLKHVKFLGGAVSFG